MLAGVVLRSLAAFDKSFARAYGITVRYNSELPEAKALPENVKKNLKATNQQTA
jgi:hypothetical protein